MNRRFTKPFNRCHTNIFVRKLRATVYYFPNNSRALTPIKKRKIVVPLTKFGNSINIVTITHKPNILIAAL